MTRPDQTIDEEEIKKFEKMSQDWWNPQGAFKPLHDLGPTRIEFISRCIKQNITKENLEINIIDIGCGGGLVSENLAKLKYNVTAIDASEVNIEIAKNHAASNNLKINYQATTAEEISLHPQKYDVVLALEIVEHVANLDLFLQSCANLVDTQGIIIFSTINKTIKSYLSAIIAAEYIFKWLPRGTHDFKKFLKPSEIILPIENLGFKAQKLQGLTYHPITKSWGLSDDYSVNYFVCLKKDY
jgi:2-polyprenyl-6-hydroxyphenyl methylase/3-demethylubiquinone-9 3-methyltransferase